MDPRPIGIFDSGLGGLTSLPWLIRELPHERVVYFGDTARTPYGSKTAATIRSFSEEIVRFLLQKDVKMIMIACNTVTSTALPWLQERFPDVHFAGIIEPMAERIASDYGSGARLAVIGTKMTVESRVYPESIRALAPGIEVLQKACPVLVPLIEEGLADHDMMRLAIRHYLDDFLTENDLRELILGCTHYPLIAGELRALYPQLHILDPSREIVLSVRRMLEEYDQLAPTAREEERRNIFYASDLSEHFVRMIESILGKDESTIKFRNLEKDAS